MLKGGFVTIAILAAAMTAGGMTRQTSFNADWEYRWEDEAQWKGTSVPHDATDHASFVHPEHPMFRGSLMLVLRPASPKVSVTARGPGIPAQTWVSRR